MSNSSRQPGLGDVPLPIERPHVNLDSLSVRNSFAKAATPEYHGLFIEDYADLTPEQIGLITPDYLSNALMNASKTSSNTVFYRNPETRTGNWIALTPLEFKQTAGNIETLGKTVVSQVNTSRPVRSDFGPDREAAVRGGVHAVEDKLKKLTAYRDGTLQPQAGNLKWLQHAANHPGYAWKDGIDLRLSMANARFGVFQDMITALSIAGNWSPESTEKLQKVIDYKLFFDRANNQHIDNWKELLGLGMEYLGYKKAIYNEKIEKAKQYIRNNEQPVR